MLTTALFSLAVSVSPVAAQSPGVASPGPAAPATCPSVPDLPNDLATAFAYDLRPPAILRFITALDALPPRDQKRIFDAAVAAATGPGEAAAKAAIAATCPDLDEIYGQSRALYLVSNEWTLGELANAKRFSAFSDVVATAVSALTLGERLDPLVRQAALAPFADMPGFEPQSPTPAPETADGGPCAQPDSPAHTVHLVTVSYPPVAAATATSGIIKVKVHLDSFGYVRDASVYDSTAPARIGSDDLVRESILAAAATTYAPAVRACRQVAGSYLFRVDFNRR